MEDFLVVFLSPLLYPQLLSSPLLWEYCLFFPPYYNLKLCFFMARPPSDICICLQRRHNILIGLPLKLSIGYGTVAPITQRCSVKFYLWLVFPCSCTGERTGCHSVIVIEHGIKPLLRQGPLLSICKYILFFCTAF